MLHIDQIGSFYPEMPKDHDTMIHLLKEHIELMVLDYLSHTKWMENLSFIGGTNLRLVKGIDRFSEDLDFDIRGMDKTMFLEMTDEIASFLRKSGLPVVVEDKDNNKLTAFRRTIKFPEYLYDKGLSDFREKKFLLKIEAQDQGVEYERNQVFINKNGYAFPFMVPPDSILCAMKTDALLHRGKGRDFYDFSFLSGIAFPSVNYLAKRRGISSYEDLFARMDSIVSTVDFALKSRDFELLLFDKSRSQSVKQFPDLYEEFKKRFYKKQEEDKQLLLRLVVSDTDIENIMAGKEVIINEHYFRPLHSWDTTNVPKDNMPICIKKIDGIVMVLNQKTKKYESLRSVFHSGLTQAYQVRKQRKQVVSNRQSTTNKLKKGRKDP